MKNGTLPISLALGFGLGVASLGAQAGSINLGGVFVPTGDTDKSGSLHETVVQTSGDTLRGFGRVTEFNGDLAPTFCPGCELTFEFGDYQLENADPANLVFSGGFINFYVDDSPNFDRADDTTAFDGDLWLSALGVEQQIDGVLGTLFGELEQGSSLGSGEEVGSGSGLFSVGATDAGTGLANDNFDTDTFTATGLGTLADLTFSTSFQEAFSDVDSDYGLSGTGELQGHAVPEPAVLGLMGLGLLMLGATIGLRRRDSYEA